MLFEASPKRCGRGGDVASGATFWSEFLVGSQSDSKHHGLPKTARLLHCHFLLALRSLASEFPKQVASMPSPKHCGRGEDAVV